MSRRRLSTVKPLVAPVAAGGGGGDDDDDDAGAPAVTTAAPKRRQSTRKSFGTAYTQKDDGAAAALPGGALNAAGLSAMYTTVIKLSTENKINVKNSWSLPLIDHMETLVMGNNSSSGGGGGAGAGAGGAPPAKGGKAGLKAPAPAAAAPAAVDADGEPALTRTGNAAVDAAMLNFQRASCALDASVKIYSYRVDDVWSTSYRVLENLSRTEPVPAEGGEGGAGGEGGDGEDGLEDDEDGDGEGGPKKKGFKRGGKGSASLSSGSTTLERNPAALCLSRLESAFDIDPLFHKMSAEFDAGGTAGMLLHRLALQGGCALAFDSTDTPDVDGAPGGGFSYALAPPAVAGGPPQPAAAALPPADSAALLAALLQGGCGINVPAPVDGEGEDGAASRDAAAAFLAALAAAGWSPSLDALYAGTDRYASAAGEAAPGGGAGAGAGVALPAPPPSAGGPMALPRAGSSSAAAAGDRDEDGVLLDDAAAASGDGAGNRSAWDTVAVLQRSARRASLLGASPAPAGAGVNTSAASTVRGAPPESPGKFEQMKAAAAAAGAPAAAALVDLDVSAIDAAVMVVAEAAAEAGVPALAGGDGAFGGADDDGDGRRDNLYGGDDGYEGDGVNAYAYGDDSDNDDDGGAGGGLNNTTIIDPRLLGLQTGAAPPGTAVKGRGKGAAQLPGLALDAATGKGVGMFGGAPGTAVKGAAAGEKHWKFKAAAQKAVDEGDAPEDDEDGADGKKGAAAGGKKGAKGKGPFFLDFTSPDSAPPKGAFDKAKKVGATSALAKALAKTASLGARVAPGAGGAAAASGGRDSEQQTAGALERAEKAGPAAFLTPLGLWPGELRSLRGPAAALRRAALTLTCRPGVEVPVAVVAAATPAADGIVPPPQPGFGAAAGLFRAVPGARALLARAGSASGTNTTFAAPGSGYEDGGGGDNDDDEVDAGAGFGFGDGAGYDEGGGMGADHRGGDEGAGGAPSSAAAAAEAPPPPPGGPVELVAAARQVARIGVRYETTAKKVDVRGLKEAMWGTLEGLDAGGRVGGMSHRDQERAMRATAAAGDRLAGASAFVDPTMQVHNNDGPAEDVEDPSGDGAGVGRATRRGGAAAAAPLVIPPTAASFAGVIGSLASSGALAGGDAAAAAAITVPFYFITVLHLANEHGLALGGLPATVSASEKAALAAAPADPLADFAIRKLVA